MADPLEKRIYLCLKVSAIHADETLIVNCYKRLQIELCFLKIITVNEPSIVTVEFIL